MQQKPLLKTKYSDYPDEIAEDLTDHFVEELDQGELRAVWRELPESKKRAISEILCEHLEATQAGQRYMKKLKSVNWFTNIPSIDASILPPEIWLVILDYTLDAAYPFWCSAWISVCKEWNAMYHQLVRARIKELQASKDLWTRRVAWLMALRNNNGDFAFFSITLDDADDSDEASEEKSIGMNTEGAYFFVGFNPFEEIIPPLKEPLSRKGDLELSGHGYRIPGDWRSGIWFYEKIFRLPAACYDFECWRIDCAPTRELLGIEEEHCVVMLSQEDFEKNAKSTKFLSKLIDAVPWDWDEVHL